MAHYSVQPRHEILLKDYEFLSFARNMAKKIGKITIKSLSDKYRKKLFDHAKQSATGELNNASERALQKIAKANSDWIGTKIASKIIKVSKSFPEVSSETAINETENIEHGKEIPKEIYIYIYIYICISKEDRKLLII